MAARTSILVKIFGILAILALILSAMAPVFYSLAPNGPSTPAELPLEP